VRRSLFAAAACVLSCANPQPGDRPRPTALEGSWSLRAQDASYRSLRLEVAFDSSTGSAFRARVVFMMSGDVGLDPTRFEPTRGEIGEEGRLHFTVKLKGRTEPTAEFSGTLAGDTIRLSTYRWGGEDQGAGGTRWLLVRVK
jgi:hypothetical protein